METAAGSAQPGERRAAVRGGRRAASAAAAPAFALEPVEPRRVEAQTRAWSAELPASMTLNHQPPIPLPPDPQASKHDGS